MKKDKRLFVFVFLFAGIFSENENCFAQVDSVKKDSLIYKAPDIHPAEQVYTLPTQTYFDAIKVYTRFPGTTSTFADSLMISRNQAGTMADLLSSNGTFIKSYGSGSLAVASVRGAAASQTPVLWNGVDLRSTTNGNVDLSLIPGILFDNSAVQNGAGVNGIGGAIALTTAGTWSAPGSCHGEIKYTTKSGSFGETEHGFKGTFASGKFQTEFRGYYQHAKNDFAFNNVTLPGSPVQTLVNSEFDSKGAQAGIRFNSDNYKHQLSAFAWYHSSLRGIPPSMFENNGDAFQEDRFLRSQVSYDHHGDKVDFRLHSSFLTEYLNFYPGYHLDSSITNSIALDNAASMHWKIRHVSFDALVGQMLTQASVSEYLPLTSQSRYRGKLFAQYVWRNKVNMALNVGDEFLGNKAQPFTGSLGIDYYAKDWLSFQLAACRNYRLPTFNDLYWNPGGNPDLKPEDSRELDGGANCRIARNEWEFNYRLSGFYRHTSNWIQWQPGPGYWLPKNLYEVESYGVDHYLKVQWKTAKWNCEFIGTMNYVRAVNVKANITGDQTIGKQLMYLPAYKMNGLLHISYDRYYIEASENFTGLRFTATDHSSWLPAYTVTDLTLGKRFDTKEMYADLFVRVNNVLNEEYQAIAYRPMPGRWYEIGFTFDLNYQHYKSTVQ